MLTSFVHVPLLPPEMAPHEEPQYTVALTSDPDWATGFVHENEMVVAVEPVAWKAVGAPGTPAKVVTETVVDTALAPPPDHASTPKQYDVYGDS